MAILWHVRFRLLGSFEVITDSGQPLPLSRRRERTLLGVLLLHVDTVVTVDNLVDLLWGERPPPAARAALQTHVSRLRTLLGVDPGIQLRRVGDGYRLRCDADSLDVSEFRRLVRSARETIGPDQRFARLGRALRLWRGPPLGDALTEPLRQRLCAGLMEERAVATEAWLAAGLTLGRHEELLPIISQLTAEHPLRESLIALQLRALFQAGRRSEALDVYSSARARLVDELGLDPSPELVTQHAAILRGEGPAAQPPERSVPAPAAELPAGVGHFTGRTSELTELTKYLENNAGETAVIAISGSAGVGKTALAVHWARQVAHDYPDGQYFVELGGHDPARARTPADALSQLLESVAPGTVGSVGETGVLAARLRSATRGRRLLVVLDNAASTEQVLPLLPASIPAVVIITSRNALSALGTFHRVLFKDLDVLDSEDAVHLLTQVIGAERASRESTAIAEIAQLCGRLPLALRIAASRLVGNPTRTAAQLVADLADRSSRLSALVTADRARSVRATFDSAYATLDPATAAVFRLIGEYPGGTVSARVLTALSGDRHATARALDELMTAHLIRSAGPDRYDMHDLIRVYAAERAEAEHPPRRREEIRDAVFDWQMSAASAVGQMIAPQASREPAPAGSGESAFGADRAELMRFMEGERGNVIDVTRFALSCGRPEVATRLIQLATPYFMTRSMWAELVQLAGIGLTAARAADDPVSVRLMHQGLGTGYAASREFETGLAHLRLSVEMAQADGDNHALGGGYNNIGRVLMMLGRMDEARAALERSLTHYRSAARSDGLATALGNLATTYLGLGNYAMAMEYAVEALTMCRETGDRSRESFACVCIADIHRARGEYATAREYYDLALAEYRELGDQEMEPLTLIKVGESYLSQNDPTALAHLREALRLHREHGHRYGEAMALARIGECHLLTDDLDGAAENLHAALAAHPASEPEEEARIYRGLGDVAYRRGALAEARRLWEHARVSYRAAHTDPAAQLGERPLGTTAAHRPAGTATGLGSDDGGAGVA